MKPGPQLFTPRLTRNERASIILSYGLVAALLTCASVPILEFGQRIRPEWNGDFLLPAIFIIALEALLAWRATRKLSFPSTDWLLYRLTELIVIVGGLKVYIYAQRGFDQFLSDVTSWQVSLGNFFGGEYLFALSLALVVWGMGTYFAVTLHDLEGDEILFHREAEDPVRSNRAAARKRLLADIFMVGGFMLVLTAILRNDLAFLNLPTPPLQTGLLNIILYFMFALILFAQSQFAVLRARWSIDRVPIAPNLASRWAVYTTLILVLAAALVIFLPTQYSLGLLDSLAIFISLIQFVFFMIIFLLWLPIQSLLSIFGRSPLSQPAPPPPPPTEAFDPSAATTTVTWFDVLKSIAFWLVVVTILVLAFVYYLRQQKELFAQISKVRGLGWLSRFWVWLRGGTRQLTDRARAALDSLIKRVRPVPIAPWSFVNPRRLSPRQQIIFYYLALVRRADVPRQPSQTPLEYQQQLTHLPPDDLTGLTDSFIEARYTQHTISPQTAQQAKTFWDHLRDFLRRKPNQSSKTNGR